MSRDHLGDAVQGTKKTGALTLQNWLYKRSPSIAKGWQRRWFVMQGDTITYFRNSEAVGEFVLQYHTIVSDAIVKKGKVYFNLITPERMFELRCDEEAIAKKWLAECNNIVKNKKETAVSLDSKVPDMPPALPTSSMFAQGDDDDDDDGMEERAAANTGTLRKGNKVEKMLGLGTLDQNKDVGEDKNDKDFEYKYRANIRYMMEKYRSSMSKSVSFGLPGNTLGGDGVYRILSLDGGGLRGIMHAVYLERLCKQFPTLLDHVDMIAGTSGGSIIAASLASNYPPAFARQIFELGGSLVFSKKTIKNVSTAKYTSKWLKTTVEEVAGDKKLNDLPRKLVVPAFQLDSYNPFQPDIIRHWGAVVSHNVGKDNHGNVPVVDAILRTIAAPTYFPSYQGYIDGGVFAHNPSEAAISLALSEKYENMHPNKVVVLSLGTGRVARYLPTDENSDYDWGLVQWAPKITDLMLDASCTSTNLFAETLLGPRYHRVNPWYNRDISMDDPGLMPALSTLANELDLTATIQWISDYFMPKPANVAANNIATPNEIKTETIASPLLDSRVPDTPLPQVGSPLLSHRDDDYGKPFNTGTLRKGTKLEKMLGLNSTEERNAAASEVVYKIAKLAEKVETEKVTTTKFDTGMEAPSDTTASTEKPIVPEEQLVPPKEPVLVEPLLFSQEPPVLAEPPAPLEPIPTTPEITTQTIPPPLSLTTLPTILPNATTAEIALSPRAVVEIPSSSSPSTTPRPTPIATSPIPTPIPTTPTPETALSPRAVRAVVESASPSSTPATSTPATPTSTTPTPATCTPTTPTPQTPPKSPATISTTTSPSVVIEAQPVPAVQRGMESALTSSLRQQFTQQLNQQLQQRSPQSPPLSSLQQHPQQPQHSLLSQSLQTQQRHIPTHNNNNNYPTNYMSASVQPQSNMHAAASRPTSVRVIGKRAPGTPTTTTTPLPTTQPTTTAAPITMNKIPTVTQPQQPPQLQQQILQQQQQQLPASAPPNIQLLNYELMKKQQLRQQQQQQQLPGGGDGGVSITLSTQQPAYEIG